MRPARPRRAPPRCRPPGAATRRRRPGGRRAAAAARNARRAAAARGTQPRERVAIGGEAARHERRLDGARARQHDELGTALEHEPHEHAAGIGHAGHARVRDEHDRRRPRPRAPRAPGARRSSACSSQTTSGGAAMPSAESSARVRRVSSQAITSAPRSASSTRAVTSPRLPIGVGQTVSIRLRTVPAGSMTSRRARRRREKAPLPDISSSGRRDRDGRSDRRAREGARLRAGVAAATAGAPGGRARDRAAGHRQDAAAARSTAPLDARARPAPPLVPPHARAGRRPAAAAPAAGRAGSATATGSCAPRCSARTTA